MTEILDGRGLAWISAWNCVESAQQTRMQAMKVQDERTRKNDDSDASHYFSQMTQHYNGLMEEARIFADLAAVSDLTVGLSAGDYLRKQREAREQQEAMQADFMRRFTERREQSNEPVPGYEPGLSDDVAKGDADESSS